MAKKERNLGRGLEALFSQDKVEYNSEEISQIDINDIVIREDQPRRSFDQQALDELAASIREHGILQPILVRPVDHKYEIIAGERRYRAAKIANIDMVPVIIREVSDREAAEIALIENLQREDLSVIEEGLAYKAMISRFDYTQETVAEKVGKSRAHIANTIRILSLPQEILQMIEEKLITAGHARTLLSIEDKDEQIRVAKEIAARKMSVRKAEQKSKARKNNSFNKPMEFIDIEERLQKYFGTKAEISPKRKGGAIQITYYSQEDLQRILDLLGII